MAKKDKKRIGVAGALMWRITALTMALWLMAMGTITWSGACATRDRFRAEFQMAVMKLPEYERSSFDDAVFDILEHYDHLDSIYWDPPIALTDTWSGDYMGHSVVLRDCAEDWHEGSPDPYPGPVILEDGNYLYFYFYWSTLVPAPGEERTGGYAVIDLDETAFGREFKTQLDDRFRSNDTLMGSDHQIDGWTGYFEGAMFHLVSVVDYPDHWSYDLDKPPVNGNWVTTVGTAPEGQSLVTLYPHSIRYHLAYEEPVTVDGITYDTLGALLLSDAPTGEDSLLDPVYISRVDIGGLDGEPESQVLIGMHSRPLAYTVASIWPLYIYTLIPLAVALLLIWCRIRRELVKPMQLMIRKGEEDFTPLFDPALPQWEEVRRLQQVYTRQVQELKKENTQLRTALNYAKDAEESRKKMISGISHELKTPLAIIHSYAEGLDEGIAREKQAHYLDVILEETEHMDALVLEMLDHSRLEAGRVRLQSDRFSLAGLTRQILDVFDPLVKDRGLTLETQTMEELQITADEARIAQAIRNLIGNAIKYTRPEGKIRVNVYHYQDKIHFSVENQCDPLPEEALEKIWDNYYRSEASEKAKGTGLGLPIVKAIIELHGGSCTAYNTSEGVKFIFSLKN